MPTAWFTPAERRRILNDLVTAARADLQITAAAQVGSAARGEDDDWSDIDLALRLASGVSPTEAVPGWTRRMYARHGAVDHLDVWSESALYRVFLLSSTLQVDLSLWPDADFRPVGGSLKLIFGSAADPSPLDPTTATTLAQLGWLYALHLRSALARGRTWQAVHLLDGLRDQVVALCCLRHDLPTHEGRGVDRLPAAILDQLATTRPAGLDPDLLAQAFTAGVDMLLGELARHDPLHAERVRATLAALTAAPWLSGSGPAPARSHPWAGP